MAPVEFGMGGVGADVREAIVNLVHFTVFDSFGHISIGDIRKVLVH